MLSPFIKSLVAVPILGWFCLGSNNSEALALRYGTGDFVVNAELASAFSGRMTIPVQTWTLAQQPSSFGFLPLDVGFRLDFFDSAFTRQFADMAANFAGQNFPVIDISPERVAEDFRFVPVPADYQVYGTNLDLSLTKPLIERDRFTIRGGVNTGLSLPFMKTRDMRSDVNLLLEVLDSFSTELKTFKLGPTVAIDFSSADWVRLKSSIAAGLHTGSLDNTALASSLTVNGQYWSIDLSAEFDLSRITAAGGWMNGWYVGLGYQRSRWNFDSAAVKISQQQFTTPALLDFDFSHESFYGVLGYRF